MDGGRAAGRHVHVAVVYGEGRVLCSAVAETPAALTTALAEYVKVNGPVQLYPDDAAVLARLLSQGDAAAAVQYYFERVGRRWDSESLFTDVVELALV